MELLQLSYFKALAENGNLTRTAKQLYISPPALSASISRLEKELGVSLFDRVGNRLVLNARGKIFLEHTGRVLSLLDTAVTEVRKDSNNRDTVLTIATSTPHLWNGLFSQFSALYPDYMIMHSVVRINQIEPRRDLLDKYDLFITSSRDVDLSRGDILSMTLYEDDHAVVLVNSRHPLAQRRKITLYDVKDEPFIMLSPGYSARNFYDELFHAAAITPHIAMECDYIMRNAMVQQGLGVALSTEHASKYLGQASVRALPVSEPLIARDQTIFWSAARLLSTCARLFLDFAERFYKNHSWKIDYQTNDFMI